MSDNPCKCSAIGFMRDHLQGKPVPKFSWYEIMSYVALYFYTNEFSNPFVVITLQEDQRTLIVDLKFDGKIFEISITLTDEVIFPPEISIEEESGKIFFKLEKVNKRIWSTYGTMKIKILDNFKHITYTVSEKVHSFKSEYIFCLQPAQMVYMHVPFGFALKVSGTNKEGEDTFRYFCNLPFVKELNPFYSWIEDVMINHLTIPLMFLLNDTDSFVETFEIGKSLYVSDLKEIVNFYLVNEHKRILLIVEDNEIIIFLGVISFLLYRKDVTLIHLLWCVTEFEIAFCWKALKYLEIADDRFKCDLFVENPNNDWKGTTGKFEPANLLNFFSPAMDDPVTFVIILGKKTFEEKISDELQQIGISKESILATNYIDDYVELF